MMRGANEPFEIRKHGADLVKDYHKSLVFNLLRTMGPISRADLARLTTMSATSIGRIVQELIAENLVFEIGQTRAGVGRRATLLDINSDGQLALGVEIDTHGVSAGIVNLRGELVSPALFEPLPGLGVDETLTQTANVVQKAMASIDEKEASKLLAIGVTIPGAVGWPDGTVRFSPQFGWSNVPLRQLLEEKIDRPILVENNVKASALAESLFGVTQEAVDFVIVTLGSGMGAAVVTGGGLYRGPDNTAGEIGHTMIDPEGPLCDCGRRGCLQMYACISGIERMAGRRFEEIFQLAKQGDPDSSKVLDQARTYLAMGLANLACVYNPKFIVVETRFFKRWPTVIEEVQERFESFLWRPIADSVRIVPSGLNEHDAIISGASVVLHEYLTNPVSIRENKLR